MTDKELVDKVWKAAKRIRGEDPNTTRQDPYGNRISRDQFGGKGRQGWEIDHIRPASRGGSDSMKNLQAMQTKKKRDLGDTLRKRNRHNQK